MVSQPYVKDMDTQAPKAIPYQLSSSHSSIAFPGTSSPSPKSLTEKSAHHGTGKESTEEGRSRMTIDMLPDVALLQIFDSYLDEVYFIENWHTLVHVCRNWRHVVFQSPRRLGLRIHCDYRTPVRKRLEIWPPLPIVLTVVQSYSDTWDDSITPNILAALEHIDRICELSLHIVPRRLLEIILTAMQQPFPALKDLYLHPDMEIAPIIPDSFLSGSAPRLQTIYLYAIPYPGLPNLLLSATHLVTLSLEGIAHSGYISPEAMAIGLSSSIRLEKLKLEFESVQLRPDQERRRPPPETRLQLPALTHFTFEGVSEYLEDLVARIDTPLLNILKMTFIYQFGFDTSQLTQFISRTPKFKTRDEVNMNIYECRVGITLPQANDGKLELEMICGESDWWWLPALAHVCSSSFVQALVPTVEQLYIQTGPRPLPRQDDIDDSLVWLEVLRPFIAVKNLYITGTFMRRFANALQMLVGESVTEVLPALQTLVLDEIDQSGSVQENIAQFVTARQLIGHSVAVSYRRSTLWRRNNY